jgi:hypothetical protein
MKYLKITLFTLFFSALLCLSALAAGEVDSQNSGMDELNVSSGTTITVKDIEGNTLQPDEYGVYPNSVKYTVEYTGAEAGKSYVIFVLDGKNTDGIPTEGNILYIDQVTADSTTVTFEVYPKNITSGGKIYITNYAASTLLQLASYVYYAPYTLGDVNDNGDITTYDALLALQISVDRPGFTDKQKLAADVNKNGEVTTYDALRILQYTVGRFDNF